MNGKMNSNSIPLHTHLTKSLSGNEAVKNPLPQVLRTPSGLALLELQGTINLPEQDDIDTITSTNANDGVKSQETPIGRLVFPLYDEKEADGGSGWMKRVYLYVGKHQRLTGEVKKLPKAVAVIRRLKAAGREDGEGYTTVGEELEGKEELEIVEIVKYKIIFSIRPEPVGTWSAEE